MEEGIWAGLGEVIPVTTKLVKLDEDLQRGVKQGKAFIADTPEELAEKIGVDPRVLKENIDEYNHYCDKNHDDLFAKDPRYLRPVRTAKFYGVKSQALIMATLGGIKINEKAEVQNKQSEVIPGLYAAGNCAGGIYGDSYDVSNTTGGALSFAINSGRIAGENALKYISQ